MYVFQGGKQQAYHKASNLAAMFCKKIGTAPVGKGNVLQMLIYRGQKTQVGLQLYCVSSNEAGHGIFCLQTGSNFHSYVGTTIIKTHRHDAPAQ